MIFPSAPQAGPRKWSTVDSAISAIGSLGSHSRRCASENGCCAKRQTWLPPLGFILPRYHSRRLHWEFSAGVTIYDLMAIKWDLPRFQRRVNPAHVPRQINPTGLRGGHLYYDAQMDDSRLVIRILRDAVRRGGVAINYASADALLADRTGRVCGVRVRDNSGYGLPHPGMFFQSGDQCLRALVRPGTPKNRSHPAFAQTARQPSGLPAPGFSTPAGRHAATPPMTGAPCSPCPGKA